VVAAAAPVTGSNTQPRNYSGDFLPASGTQTFVTVTAVPEPSTYVMLAIAGGIGAIAARRRRKSAQGARWFAAQASLGAVCRTWRVQQT